MKLLSVHVLVLAALVWASLVSVALALSRAQYASALDKSILFFDLQRSGRLPSWQRLRWRGDSGLNDGRAQGVCMTVALSKFSNLALPIDKIFGSTLDFLQVCL